MSQCLPVFGGSLTADMQRGKSYLHLFGGSFGNVRLPTDPVGTFNLTLTNVVVGSAIQVEVQSTGAVLENRTAASSSETINLSTYAPGSPLNDLRIKVRKGSAAPFYKNFETLTTSSFGSQSIYVAQIPD